LRLLPPCIRAALKASWHLPSLTFKTCTNASRKCIVNALQDAWVSLKPAAASGKPPRARSSHGALALGDRILVFGGMAHALVPSEEMNTLHT